MRGQLVSVQQLHEGRQEVEWKVAERRSHRELAHQTLHTCNDTESKLHEKGCVFLPQRHTPHAAFAHMSPR